MKRIAWLAAFALVLSTVALSTVAVATSPDVAVLDGTSWKVDVEPDEMSQKSGERQFKETLTFADGNISFSAPKVGFAASPYTVTKSGEKDWIFKASRATVGEGSSVWTGSIHENNLKGKLIWTKNDGAVLTYNFKGNKLD